MSLIRTYTLATKLMQTNRLGAVYCFYLLTIALLLYCFSIIKRIDSEERRKDGYKGIYLGRMKKFFISEAEEKDHISKKALILELIGYACFLITIALASISWMLEVYLISALSWFWFLLVVLYTAIIRIIHVKMIKPKNMIDY